MTHCPSSIPSRGRHPIAGKGRKVSTELVEDQRPWPGPRPMPWLWQAPTGGDLPEQHVWAEGGEGSQAVNAPPPTAMEMAIELLWEDKWAQPQWPHMFVMPWYMIGRSCNELLGNIKILTQKFTQRSSWIFWSLVFFIKIFNIGINCSSYVLCVLE